MERREFIAGGVAAGWAALRAGLGSSRSSGPNLKVNLVPEAPSTAPNYWCTWAAQNYMYGQGMPHLSIDSLEGESGGGLANAALNEKVLFGEDGWASRFFPRVRSDLFLLLDAGWETGGTATFEVDKQKFPSFQGDPVDRLRALNGAVRREKWRSVALWCRNTPGGVKDEELEALSEAAGVLYWKVDIGDPSFHLTQLSHEHDLRLLVEHVHGEGPLNGEWDKDGRFGAQIWGSPRQQILAQTDVYRTYDVTSILSLPTTLDRLAEMLKGAEGHPNTRSLINVEDEVYVAAAMGCTTGILRHPLRGLRPEADVDLFFNGNRQTKRRMDEVTRSLLWQRIAPPFPVGGPFRTSDEVLTDTWCFKRGQTWDANLVGRTARQGAPAVISRNMSLPRVISSGEKPFVMVSRFPNGAVAACTQERTQVDRDWFMPVCRVELQLGDAPGPYAFFGCVESVVLHFDKPAGTRRLLAQDLLDTQAVDLTHRLTNRGRTLELTASDLRTIGLAGAAKNDLSAPGVVLAWR